MESLLASFLFFTRLPFWRLRLFNISSDSFKNVLIFWPLTGWLTAAVSVLTLWLTSFVFPAPMAILCVILVRLLLTGALHEDGLADFADGFGGGTTKDRILAIMKDSHIGTYGVIALILYFLFYYFSLSAIHIQHLMYVVLAADPFSKFVASLIIYRLPYARTESESKAKVIYSKQGITGLLLSFVFGVLFLVLFLKPFYWLAAVLPVLVFLALTSLMKKKINGYTGDCCGATFLVCELSFYIGIIVINRISDIVYLH